MHYATGCFVAFLGDISSVVRLHGKKLQNTTNVFKVTFKKHPTIFQKAVLGEALLRNGRYIETAVLSMGLHRQFWPLHNACLMSLAIITFEGKF